MRLQEEIFVLVIVLFFTSRNIIINVATFILRTCQSFFVFFFFFVWISRTSDLLHKIMLGIVHLCQQEFLPVMEMFMKSICE